MTDANGILTSYGELADVLAALPILLRAERRRRQLSVRATAEELEMSTPTVNRIERGEDCALSNAAKVLRWLGTTGGGLEVETFECTACGGSGLTEPRVS